MRMRCFLAFLLAGYLGLHNGYLALWNHGSNAPAHIFPYREETYSYADRAALNQGIPFQSRDELSRLLEDYFS